MAHFLKPYKNDILSAFEGKKVHLHWSKTPFIQRVQFEIPIPETNLSIGFELGYVVASKLMTVHYTYQAKMKRKIVKSSTFSLAESPLDSPYALSKEINSMFQSVQTVTAENNSIIAVTSLYDQLTMVTSIIKSNLDFWMTSIKDWAKA